MQMRTVLRIVNGECLSTCGAAIVAKEEATLESVIRAWTEFVSLKFEIGVARNGLQEVRVAGVEALARLLTVALRDTGQSKVVARFLLNLYNGNRFPFDMTDFRQLDQSLFIDCMSVLHMDSIPELEVHEYFEDGGKIWEQMAKDWGFKDYKSESWRTGRSY